MPTGYYYRGEYPSIVNVLDELGGKNLRDCIVKSLCLTCDFTMKNARPPVPWVFNMRTKKMHFAGYDEGMTICGKEATQPQWLWQL